MPQNEFTDVITACELGTECLDAACQVSHCSCLLPIWAWLLYTRFQWTSMRAGSLQRRSSVSGRG